jgi:hypothetical protein
MKREFCDDYACIASACQEHPMHNGGDHTFEQHHSPSDHYGGGVCHCEPDDSPDAQRLLNATLWDTPADRFGPRGEAAR